MKIDKVKKLRNGKYKLIFDNEENIVTYDDVIIDKMLFNGKEVTNEILSEISINNKFYEIYNKILRMITIKWRSRKEIEEYLNKQEISEERKKMILIILTDNGLINDKRYAKAYANDAVNLHKHGPLRIKEDLLKQGVAEEIIENVIYALDPSEIEDNMVSIILKKNRLNHHYSAKFLKNKLSHELLELGYERMKINEKLNMLVKSNPDIVRKEYDKLYERYSKQYSGLELKYKIKQALYLKGFEDYYDEY